MPARGRPPGAVVALAAFFMAFAAVCAFGVADLIGLAMRGERDPVWLIWTLTVATSLLTLWLLLVAWGILTARPWIARRIREFADAETTFVLGALLHGLLQNERARRWFET